jgi:hypothetical protein
VFQFEEVGSCSVGGLGSHKQRACSPPQVKVSMRGCPFRWELLGFGVAGLGPAGSNIRRPFRSIQYWPAARSREESLRLIRRPLALANYVCPVKLSDDPGRFHLSALGERGRGRTVKTLRG